MTVRLAPGSPKLTMDGKEVPGDGKLSDSSWEELDAPGPEDRTRASLARIARTRRKPARGPASSEG